MRKFVTLGLIFILIGLVGVRALAADQTAASPPPAYTLNVENERVSLKATDASLKTILLDLGKQLDIEVVFAIPADDKVNLTFEQLPLEQALRLLTAQYSQIKEYAGPSGKLVKLTVLPEQEGKTPPPAPPPVAEPPPPAATTAASPPAEPKSPRPKSFEFEFDPSAAPTAPPGQMPALPGRR